MKKTLLIAGIVLPTVLLITLSMFGYFDRFDNTVNGEFDFKSQEYREIIESDQFKTTLVLKNYTEPSAIRKEIQRVWVKKYGISVRKQKPYEMLFDPESKVWLVRGKANFDGFGGTANALVDAETGEVIAIWHGC